MDPVEIEIPFPWGIIAGKTWGSSTNPIVLLLHALEDNASSYDYLVPLLPYGYYYISIDLPGHGKSSHISPNLTLQAMDYIYVVKLLADHFSREKYIFIGHSFGSIIASQFCLIYPERVEILFMLDTLWFDSVEPSDFRSWMKNKFDEFVKTNKQIQRNIYPQVTYTQALELTKSWRHVHCKLTPEAADTLLKRGIVECRDGKFKFTRDLRLRNYVGYPMDDRYAAELLTCSRVSYKIVTIITKLTYEMYKEKSPLMAEATKKISEWFAVDGNHYVHLNNPEIVSPIINRFLEESRFPI